MLRRVLSAEASESVLIVCISSLTDAAAFLAANESLFQDKVHSVTIMGGVEGKGDETSQAALLTPDTANNNTFDMVAAEAFYLRLQELGIDRHMVPVNLPID